MINPTFKEIAPIRESRSNYDELEAKLKRFFKQHIYHPLLRELNLSNSMIKNSRVTSLIDALFSGRVTFNRGVFSGMFNSYISQDLRDLGATFDRKSATYRLTMDKLPIEIKNVISASSVKFQEKIDKIDKRLAAVVPEELAEKFDSAKLFDRTLWDVDKKFKKNVEHITIAPQLTDDHRKRIADEWSNNMKLWIKDFTQKEIISLRAKVQENVFAGNRYGSLIKTIQTSYGVSARKAKFLARQETALLMAKHKEVKYQSAGIHEYKWRCVTGTALHPVRPMHKELDKRSKAGEVFRFDDPPVDDPDGSKHNPGQNYNCLPGSNIIRLDRPISKIFRRRYSGELTLLVSNNGVVHESTGNHPILTNRGWVAAKDIQIGDYICQSHPEAVGPKEMNSKYMETSIEQVFNALSMCSEISSSALSDVDFHGDVGSDKDVDIIYVSGELVLDGISKLYKFFNQFEFESPDTFALTDGSLHQNMVAWSLTPDSIVGFLGELKKLILRHSTESKAISIGAGPDWDSTLNQPSSQWTARDRIFVGNCEFTHPILIILDSILNGFNSVRGGFKSPFAFDFNALGSDLLAQHVSRDFESFGEIRNSDICTIIYFDRVIDKTVRNFESHVYNLQSLNHWYISQNTIVHNCRCVAVPIIRAS